MVRVKEFMVGAVMHGNEAADLKSSFGLGHRMIGEAATVYDASENDVARLWPDSPGPEDPEHAWSGRFREGIRREDNGDGNLACLSRPRGRPSRFRSNRSEHLGNHAAWFIRPHKPEKFSG